MHCWDVARPVTKWARVPLANESSKRKKPSSSQTRSDARDKEFYLNLDDDDLNIEDELSRPAGRDTSKKRGQRSSASGSASGKGASTDQLNEINTHLIEFNSIQKKRYAERKSIREVFEKKCNVKEKR
ncbi:hypothetical protein Hanom_Chr16g01514081 [Helianthus anomalus]